MKKAFWAFNRGLISSLGLSRQDIKRVAMGASIMINWIPRVLGSMSLRPGLKYIGATYLNHRVKFLPFIFSTADTALIEVTDFIIRIWINDALITRPAVTAAITNGTFAANINSWTDADDSGATSSWNASGYMQLVGNGTARAIRYQQVTVNEPGVEHALRVTVTRGPLTMKVGSTVNGDDYVRETIIGAGTHSLAFTPSSNFYVQFESSRISMILIDSCTLEASGIMTLPSLWPEASLGSIRPTQSGDIVYCACAGYQQVKISRRAARSWSVELYQPEDGPFRVINVTPTTLTPSAFTGNITLTASRPTFRSTNVGSLYKIISIGQSVSVTISAENTFSNAIEVEGVGATRAFTVNISGTFAGTVRLQYSLDSDTGPWTNASTGTYSWTAPVTTTYNDTWDNTTAWWRIGIMTGQYTSGSAVCALTYATGSIIGILRITDYTSSTVVSAEILTALGGTTATDLWHEGEWSDRRGWPTSNTLHEGRMWWAGQNSIWGSVSDAFESFDDETVGDSGPLNRTIGAGAVDTINFLLSLQRLIIGADGAEFSAKSSSLDEPLTPTSFNVKISSSQGSAAVLPVKLDQSGVYIQRGGIRVFEVTFDVQSYEYGSVDISQLVPDIGSPEIVRLGGQRQPDTRLHCIRSDGTVAMVTFDKTEQVNCWYEIETDGDIEDVVIMPSEAGDTEDSVYYVVKRTINGSTVRYLEKWANETDCRGATLNLQADSFVTFTGPSATITGLSHLEGEEVIVWADGDDLSPDVAGTQTTYTVSGGQITVGQSVTSAVIGLPYTAQWQSTKIGSSEQVALNQGKKINHIGLVMAWVHAKGLRYGTDFTYAHMNDMPEIERGTLVGGDTVSDTYDEQEIIFPGKWATDLRVCLQAKAPRPVTVLSLVTDFESY